MTDFFRFLCWAGLFFILLLPSRSFSQDLSLLEPVKNNESLCNGNVDIVSFQGKGYLVSAGRSFIEGDTPEANLKAGEQAKLTAEERLMKFVYQIQISSNEELKESTEIRSVNGKEANRTIQEAILR